MQRWFTLSLCGVLLANLAACGTILYPERKGQGHGNLDVGVVILDALGLLLYFVPGVIAFAVDFSNGTIYLPQGHTLLLNDAERESIATHGKVDLPALQRVLRTRLPASTDLSAVQLQSIKIDSLQGLDARLDHFSGLPPRRA